MRDTTKSDIVRGTVGIEPWSASKWARDLAYALRRNDAQIRPLPPELRS